VRIIFICGQEFRIKNGKNDLPELIFGVSIILHFYKRPRSRALYLTGFVGYLKGKSSLMIFDRHANLKYKYGNRHFWCRGYYVDTVVASDQIRMGSDSGRQT